MPQPITLSYPNTLNVFLLFINIYLPDSILQLFNYIMYDMYL